MGNITTTRSLKRRNTATSENVYEIIYEYMMRIHHKMKWKILLRQDR